MNEKMKIEYRIQRQINWGYEVVRYNPNAHICHDQVKLLKSFSTRKEAEQFVIGLEKAHA